MKLRVLLFGALADRVGRSDDIIEVPDGSVGADVLRLMAERHPHASMLLESVSVALNREVVSASRRLGENDEVALLPPMSGGSSITVGLRERPSVDEAIGAVSAPGAGGTAVFLGTVRDHSAAGDVDRLDYSAYDEMAVNVLREVAGEAAVKWGLMGVAVFHGVGSMSVGDVTIVAACTAAHRDEAFDACRYVMDEVKRRVPVWKKEHGSWGERWVGAPVFGVAPLHPGPR